jgi:Uma2 family endonuclease
MASMSSDPATLSPYQLGASIELADFLALPPDGRRYARDAQGRLTLMSPDDWGHHGDPLTYLVTILARWLPPPWRVLHERAIAFPRIYDLKGRLLRESFLGPKALAPDIAVFTKRPAALRGPHGLTFVAPEPLRLVIEVLSPSTWRSDLGIGEAEDVDRSRSYLESGVPEYGLLNVGVLEPGCPIPPRSARWLSRSADGSRWEVIVEGLRVRSRAVAGLDLDLEEVLSECEGRE